MIPKPEKTELEAILAEISKYPEGANLQDILKKSVLSFSKRTLQRRLALLVKNQQLAAIGHGRAIRYQIRQKERITKTFWDEYVPISLVAEEAKHAVRKPLQIREPVSYNRRFLDSYVPNKTHYLSEQMLQHLQEMGKVPDGEHPAGTYARQILKRLLLDLSWNSSRLEGNTYSLLETERLLNIGEIAEGKKTFEAQMILNHKAAIEFLVNSAEEIKFNRYTILNLHALLSQNLLVDPLACGRLRNIPVNIAKTVYYPSAVPQLIDECFQLILDKATAIHNPFEQAFFLMAHIPYLQPFEDVNKRVSRLSANIPFIKNNLSPLSFVDVPENAYIDGLLAVYELNRIELLRDVFVWAYERSAARYAAIRHSLGEPDPLRLRFHKIISEIIFAVVRDHLNKKDADIFIKKQVNATIPEKNRARLVEIIETELGALHEGNIARYHIRPLEFEAWHKTWE
jgi:hypothetical protein